MLSSDYAIRLAAAEDLRALAGIEREADTRFDKVREQAGLVAATLTDVTPVVSLEEGQRDGRLWVATFGGHTIVGFALACVVAGFAHLEELAVLPHHGRVGLGSALLEAVCAWAREARYPAVTLTTFRDIPWNGPFYARRGFQIVPPAQLANEYVEIVESEHRRGFRRELRVLMARRTAS